MVDKPICNGCYLMTVLDYIMLFFLFARIALVFNSTLVSHYYNLLVRQPRRLNEFNSLYEEELNLGDNLCTKSYRIL